MAATYMILADGQLLYGGNRIGWPGCLHIQAERLSDRHPGMWVVQVLDDDAPEELEGKQVDLTLQRKDGHVHVIGRQAVVF